MSVKVRAFLFNFLCFGALFILIRLGILYFFPSLPYLITFVITGSVEHFKNRKEMQEIIETNGGKVSSSVSVKTNYLINNDKESSSSKNKKAKELNIPILSEKDFLDLLEQ